MENKNWIKKAVFCISVVVIEIILYLGASRYITAQKERYFVTGDELLRAMDCSAIFDAYAGCSFEIKFEICAEKEGTVVAYQSTPSRYDFLPMQSISVTEEYKEVCFTVSPVLVDETTNNAYLIFYGEYGSGVIPTVRDICINPIE